ncbi:MAG: anti-sigma factor family protein [Acidimicrobiales bacterium]
MMRQLFRRGMSCSQVLEVLQSYIDGETDEETARNVLAHLDRCERCDRESFVYRRIKVSLSSREIVVDPEVMAALTRFGERVARGDLPDDLD